MAKRDQPYVPPGEERPDGTYVIAGPVRDIYASPESFLKAVEWVRDEKGLKLRSAADPGTFKPNFIDGVAFAVDIRAHAAQVGTQRRIAEKAAKGERAVGRLPRCATCGHKVASEKEIGAGHRRLAAKDDVHPYGIGQCFKTEEGTVCGCNSYAPYNSVLMGKSR